MVNDVGYIQSYVDGRLVLFVQLAEEDQLLNGNGTAPNLRGILNRRASPLPRRSARTPARTRSSRRSPRSARARSSSPTRS
jgi:hypothetical protein